MRILTLLLFTCTISLSYSQNFSIEEAKAYALDNNLSVAEANNAIEIARLKIIETRGMGLPQVDFNGNFSHFINLPVTVLDAKFFNPLAADGETISFEAGTKFTSTGTLQVNQLIFNGSYIVGLQTASLFAKFQNNISDQSKEEVIFNVINAYQIATVAKENLVFMDSLVESTKKLVKQQQHFLDLGMIQQEDVDQLNYSLINAKSVQTTAQIQLENALSMLKLAMGYPMNDSIELSNSINDLLQKESISKGDIHSNLSFTMIEKKVQLQALNLKNNKFANLPSLNAYFQQTYNAYRNEFNLFANEKWFPQTVWGLQLNIPIFSGLSRYARTSQAKVELLNTENQLTQLEQHLQFQEIQTRNNLKGAENKYQLLTKNVELANSIYQKAITKNEIGKGNSMLVTQKHNQLMMAQAQLIGSTVELFQAKLAIDKLYNNILPNK
ncbi:MAG TPA: TolC family protein [Crocinitomicaceae bacterium]|nr:TolC family protein [Crocinitomicaceae bacterium]